MTTNRKVQTENTTQPRSHSKTKPFETLTVLFCVCVEDDDFSLHHSRHVPSCKRRARALRLRRRFSSTGAVRRAALASGGFHHMEIEMDG
jgi:hypothetical protein